VVEKFLADSPSAGHELLAQNLANAPTGVGPGVIPELGAMILANVDLFRAQQVVPEAEQQLPQQLQYGVTTPRTYREVGKATGTSPRILRSIIEAAGTAPVQQFTAMTDWILDTFMPEARDQQVQEALDKVKDLSPELRELYLTTLSSDLRQEVEIQSLTRQAGTPFEPTIQGVGRAALEGVGALVGPTLKRFRPQTGGELEQVMPRSAKARESDMITAMGVDAITALTADSKAGGLNLGVPVMNDTVGAGGHYTKLNDEQLSAAHRYYKEKILETVVPILLDPTFQSYPYDVRKDVVRDYLRDLEAKIRKAALTQEQRTLLGLE